MSGEALDNAFRIAFSSGLIGVVAVYLRDRRKYKAEGRVAEATTELVIDDARLANLEKRFRLAHEAWDLERLSLERSIGRLTQEVTAEREESAAKDVKIAELGRRVDSMRQELAKLAEELAGLRNGNHTD